MDYLTFQQAIDKYRNEKPKLTERQEILKQLYGYYEKSYKKNTWSEYVKWLKQTKTKHSKKSVEDYKKKAFKKITISSFCSYWLSHIPTKDLYYLLSYARDMDNRGENFNKWLFWSLNPIKHKK